MSNTIVNRIAITGEIPKQPMKEIVDEVCIEHNEFDFYEDLWELTETKAWFRIYTANRPAFEELTKLAEKFPNHKFEMESADLSGYAEDVIAAQKAGQNYFNYKFVFEGGKCVFNADYTPDNGALLEAADHAAPVEELGCSTRAAGESPNPVIHKTFPTGGKTPSPDKGATAEMARQAKEFMKSGIPVTGSPTPKRKV